MTCKPILSNLINQYLLTILSWCRHDVIDVPYMFHMYSIYMEHYLVIYLKWVIWWWHHDDIKSVWCLKSLKNSGIRIYTTLRLERFDNSHEMVFALCLSNNYWYQMHSIHSKFNKMRPVIYIWYSHEPCIIAVSFYIQSYCFKDDI